MQQKPPNALFSTVPLPSGIIHTTGGVQDMAVWMIYEITVQHAMAGYLIPDIRPRFHSQYNAGLPHGKKPCIMPCMTDQHSPNCSNIGHALHHWNDTCHTVRPQTVRLFFDGCASCLWVQGSAAPTADRRNGWRTMP